jgi:hypothetical protein
MNNNITESDLKIKMINYLTPFFLVEQEVWSTDNKKRIDLVIVHKSDLNKKYPIGIEIKKDDKKRGKQLALWLKQASVYSEKEFKGYGKCLITTCPQVSGFYLREGEFMNQHEFENGVSQDNNIATFLSEFNIGEFQKYTRNSVTLYRIAYKGQIIWDRHENSFRTHNYERLCK